MNKKELAEQITPEKALSNLWRQKQSELIDKHIIPMYATLRAQSISYFLKDGTVSGSFRQALEDIMNDVRKFIAPQPAAAIIEAMGEKPEVEGGEDLKSKVEFYRKQTDKLRDFVNDNNIGKPSQNIFDALYEYVNECRQSVEAMGKPESEFEALADELYEWSNKTFGERPALAPVYHLKKEVVELIEALEKDPENWRAIESELADCFLLITDASRKRGLTSSGIISNARGKFDKVKQRKWGKPDENGVVEHIRDKVEAMGVQPGMSECESPNDFWVECNVCKQQLKNWTGSTPCCGSIAYMVVDGKPTTKISLFASVGGGPIKPTIVDLKPANDSNVADNQESIAKCDNPPCSNVKFNTLAGFNLCTCGWSEAIEPKGDKEEQL